MRDGRPVYDGLDAALALPGVAVHLYGKTSVRPFRKMGHLTAIGATADEAYARAMAARSHLHIRPFEPVRSGRLSAVAEPAVAEPAVTEPAVTEPAVAGSTGSTVKDSAMLPSQNAGPAESGYVPAVCLDVQAVLARLGDDVDLASSVFDMFVRRLGGMLADVEAASASGNSHQIRRAAHALRGAAAAAGGERVRAAAEALEIAALVDDSVRISAMLDTLRLEADCLAVAIQSYLASSMVP